MKPAIEINDPAMVASGLLVDPLPNQIALWKDGSNVLFIDGEVVKRGGWDLPYDALGPIGGLAQAYVNGQKRTYVGTGTKLFKFQDGARTEIGSGFTGGAWSMATYGAFLIATNDTDHPKVWKDSGTVVDYGPIARARIVRKLSGFPMLFHGQEAYWPAYNDFEDFVPGPGKRAGSFFVRDLDGDIEAVEPLGNVLVYYTQDMFGTISFIGGESAFGFITNQKGGIGAVGPDAVAGVGPFHYGLSKKGIWKSDGNSFEYIANGAILKWLKANINWTQAVNTRALHNEARRLVEFHFMCLDGTIRGVAYNYANGSWTILVAPVLFLLEQGVYDYPLVAIGNLWGFYDKGDNAGAAALSAAIETAPLAAGTPRRYKLWDKLVVFFEADGVVEFRVGYSDTPQGEPDWTEWAQLSHDDNWLSDRESVFIKLGFRSTAVNADWRLSGFEVFGEATGSTL
jgi:hypothetical protein